MDRVAARGNAKSCAGCGVFNVESWNRRFPLHSGEPRQLCRTRRRDGTMSVVSAGSPHAHRAVRRVPTGRHPKQYRTPSCEPITTLPSAIAGEADSGAPVSNSQSFSPFSRSRM